MAGQSVFRLTWQLNLFAVLFYFGLSALYLPTNLLAGPTSLHRRTVQPACPCMVMLPVRRWKLVQFSTIRRCPPPLFLSSMLFIYGQDTHTLTGTSFTVTHALRQAGCGSGWILMFLPDLNLGSYLVFFDNCKWWKEWKIYFKKYHLLGSVAEPVLFCPTQGLWNSSTYRVITI